MFRSIVAGGVAIVSSPGSEYSARSSNKLLNAFRSLIVQGTSLGFRVPKLGEIVFFSLLGVLLGCP
ncbi:MAG: hypothetical protein CBC35_12365 [Planctomycetes bacterium TMED75]|nr:MAG: hypothetical protein CBC35_12365 [Planctomycetes bacterium TMED75]